MADVADPERSRARGAGRRARHHRRALRPLRLAGSRRGRRPGAHYLDSTGEPPFIREVFERYGLVAASNDCGMLTAFGYDFVPGNLAGALALDVPGMTQSESTRGTTSPARLTPAR